MHDQVYIAKKGILIFHSQLSPQNRELFDLGMESVAPKIKKKIKEQVATLLYFFWDEVSRVKRQWVKTLELEWMEFALRE